MNFPVLHSSPGACSIRSTESLKPSNHLITYCPLLLLPSIFPSPEDFCNELAFHIRWPKYWSLSMNPSNEVSGLICFTIEWFDLLAVQGTLKSLLQHHSSKALIFQCSAFLKVQISYPFLTTGFGNMVHGLSHTQLPFLLLLTV